MNRPRSKILPALIGSAVLLLTLAAAAVALWKWKEHQHQAAAAAAKSQPEHSESVQADVARTASYTRTSTAIGTARALRSVTLRNELPGTVREVHLQTGKVVEAGELLVQLDVAVETAQLAALQAEARLAETMLGRMERALQNQGASAADVDRARAERDMAVANVQRLEAVIAQKCLRAPFAARTGLVDLHVGQYLEPGTSITTLQGLDDAVHIDFQVTQDTARHLQPGGTVDVTIAAGLEPMPATIAALDARVDSTTRNVTIRAELRGPQLPAPGASVRVRMPVAAPRDVVVVPVSALRRDPGGAYVFLLAEGEKGQTRAQMRRVVSGAVLRDEVVIEEGLTTGERIAAAGSFKLYPGALVVVTNPTTTGN